MRYASQTRGVLFAYDIREVLKALEPILIEWMAFRSFLTHLREDDLVDLWLAASIYDFQIVSVKGYNKNAIPAEMINTFRHGAETARRTLYHSVYLPPEAAGSEVIIKRYKDTLWLVSHYPDQMEPMPRTALHTPQPY